MTVPEMPVSRNMCYMTVPEMSVSRNICHNNMTIQPHSTSQATQAAEGKSLTAQLRSSEFCTSYYEIVDSDSTSHSPAAAVAGVTSC